MKIEKRAKRKIESASDNCGTYKVLSEEGLIYCGFSSNIKMGLQRLINRLKDNKYRKHIKMICKVETEETQNSIKAIIRHKKNIIELHPEFEDMIRLYDDYVYLAVDFKNPPFLKLVETTQEEYFYIGPFRSRFFIPDLIQTMNKMFYQPFCEQEEFPCVKLRNRECNGYCVETALEFSDSFYKYFLNNNNKDFRELEQKYEQYFEELKFSKAEELSDYLRIINKHFSHLELILSMKNLDAIINFEGGKLTIKNGLVVEYKPKDGKKEKFETEIVEYRESEMLAINKSQFYEMLVLFKFLKSEYPKIVDQNYKKNFSRVKKYFKK